MNKFLTVKEVAELFNVSVGTVNRLMNSRKIAFFHIGGLIRFSEEDVKQFLEDNFWDWSKQPKIKL